MSVRVYNGEKFQRGKVWYLIFTLVFACVFLLSIFYNNIVGAVVMFFLLGWYFYYSTINNQVVTMKAERTQLLIWTKSYPWNSFTWFALEPYSLKDQRIKNIVFVTASWHMIYSFDDSLAHVETFITELTTSLPGLGDYHQTFLDRFSRRCKL